MLLGGEQYCVCYTISTACGTRQSAVRRRLYALHRCGPLRTVADRCGTDSAATRGTELACQVQY
eukprot:3224778-Rhodomonas_salina.1